MATSVDVSLNPNTINQDKVFLSSKSVGLFSYSPCKNTLWVLIRSTYVLQHWHFSAKLLIYFNGVIDILRKGDNIGFQAEIRKKTKTKKTKHLSGYLSYLKLCV